MSASKRILGLFTILFTLGVIALSASRPQRAHSGYSELAVGDSAYQAELRNWLRDSAVLDSLTRQVNTSELYALYRQALGKEGVTLRLMTDLGCEELRLAMRYGAVPWQRASDAVRDTVYRDIGSTDALDYIARHAPNEGIVETGQNCRPFPPRAPDLIGKTRLDVAFPKPGPKMIVPTAK